MSACTQNSWYLENVKSFEFLKKTYPFLQNFNLPIDFFTLKEFYRKDMERRNLKPLPEYYNCYEFVFSYFIANYDQQENPDRPKGNTDIGYILDAIPKGIDKTVTQTTNFLSSFKEIIFLLLILIVFIYFLKIR